MLAWRRRGRRRFRRLHYNGWSIALFWQLYRRWFWRRHDAGGSIHEVLRWPPRRRFAALGNHLKTAWHLASRALIRGLCRRFLLQLCCGRRGRGGRSRCSSGRSQKHTGKCSWGFLCSPRRCRWHSRGGEQSILIQPGGHRSRRLGLRRYEHTGELAGFILDRRYGWRGRLQRLGARSISRGRWTGRARDRCGRCCATS